METDVLARQERESLQALRLCTPRARDRTRREELCLMRPRVLIPNRLLHHFALLPKHGGRIEYITVRSQICDVANSVLGRPFHPGADADQAPDRFSAGSLIKWTLSHVGICIPHAIVDQPYCGTPVPARYAHPGCLFYFAAGQNNALIDSAGIVAGDEHVIRASPAERCVVRKKIEQRPVVIVDFVPEEFSHLVLLPDRMTGVETALDVVRWLQDRDG